MHMQMQMQGMDHHPDPDQENEEPCYIYASVTVDRVLAAPEEAAGDVIPGKESRALFNYVHKWMDSIGNPRDCSVWGTDIEGQSRLITRYITPQEPPKALIDDPQQDVFAIEKVSRFVSLVPFLTDAQMFEGRAMDLWCTSKTFLDISCGDYEEHAILLCNYFNFIDKRRAELDPSRMIVFHREFLRNLSCSVIFSPRR